MYDKIVIVTLKTRLEELIERFNTREQAKFYIEHMGLNFADYEREHDAYAKAVHRLRRDLEGLTAKMQVIDRSFLPNFLFTPRDLVVAVGRDGLVANTAKYLEGQPIIGVNPDPGRYDGILVRFGVGKAKAGVMRVLEEKAAYNAVTMAEVVLNDSQRLLAFNDFYIGMRTHVSSRYSLTWHGKTERQSSSGIIVSTGAGSTGWLSSTQHMAHAVSRLLMHEQIPRMPMLRLDWDDPRLVFVVREPFLSKASGVRLTAGMVDDGEDLKLESHMPDGGIIYSDGIDSDVLAFNSGTVATIRAAQRQARLAAA